MSNNVVAFVNIFKKFCKVKVVEPYNQKVF